jgi:hypothetical protein
MPGTYRLLGCSAVVCLLSALALVQVPAADEIVANQNRIPVCLVAAERCLSRLIWRA